MQMYIEEQMGEKGINQKDECNLSRKEMYRQTYESWRNVQFSPFLHFPSAQNLQGTSPTLYGLGSLAFVRFCRLHSSF